MNATTTTEGKSTAQKRKRIRITEQNAGALQATLKTIQSGRGQNDVSVAKLLRLAEEAEDFLAARKIAVSRRAGACAEFAAGGASITEVTVTRSKRLASPCAVTLSVGTCSMRA